MELCRYETSNEVVLILEYGYDLIIDLGPSYALSTFLQETHNPAKLITLANYRSVEGVRQKIKSLII